MHADSTESHAYSRLARHLNGVYVGMFLISLSYVGICCVRGNRFCSESSFSFTQSAVNHVAKTTNHGASSRTLDGRLQLATS